MSLDEAIAKAVRDAVRAELPGLLRAAVREAIAGSAANREDYLTTEQAAAVAQVTEDTVRTWAKSGRLRVDRRAGRRLRIRRQDLDACLATEGVEPTDAELERRASSILGRGRVVG